MLTDLQQTAYQNLYHVTGIPFIIASVEGQVIASFPTQAEKYYNVEYWSALPADFSATRHPRGVTLVCVGEPYHVAVIKLSQTLFFSTVPIRSAAGDQQNFLAALKKGIRPEFLVQFYRFLAELPVYSNIQLSEMASLAKIIYCGEAAEGTSVVYLTERGTPLREIQSPPVPRDYQTSQEERRPAKHASVDFESSIEKCIEQGEEGALLDALQRPMYGTIGRMSLNDLRQVRYEFICMMFTCCRAAIRGGLSAEYGYDLSDLFCQRMDGMTQVEEIRLYLQECMRTFCRKVAQSKASKGYCAYTVACCDYIRQHLLEPMDVDTISRSIGLNRRSLARYFITDTGQTISDYITQRRLEEGAYLLTNSELSIGTISELLQFSTQSKFTEKFRMQYNMTPLQYRRQPHCRSTQYGYP